MGTIHMNKKASLLIGVALALLAIPLLFDSPTSPHFSGTYQNLPLEFTDVRIVRPDLSVHSYDSENIQRITIEAEGNFNSPWCQWEEPMALPCPHQFLDKHHERNQQDIPSL